MSALIKDGQGYKAKGRDYYLGPAGKSEEREPGAGGVLLISHCRSAHSHCIRPSLTRGITRCHPQLLQALVLVF